MRKLSCVVSNMVAVGAYEGCHAIQDYVAQLGDEDALSLLEDKLLAKKTSEHGWALTRSALRPLTPVLITSSPERAFEIRTRLALCERTDWELFEQLVSSGWRWRQWVPPTQRRKKTLPIPVAYAVGDDQVFFTTPREVHRSYLLALLQAQDRHWHAVCLAARSVSNLQN